MWNGIIIGVIFLYPGGHALTDKEPLVSQAQRTCSNGTNECNNIKELSDISKPHPTIEFQPPVPPTPAPHYGWWCVPGGNCSLYNAQALEPYPPRHGDGKENWNGADGIGGGGNGNERGETGGTGFGCENEGGNGCGGGQFTPQLPPTFIENNFVPTMDPHFIYPPPMVAPPIVAPPIVAPPIVAPPIVAQPIVAPPIVAPPIVAPPQPEQQNARCRPLEEYILFPSGKLEKQQLMNCLFPNQTSAIVPMPEIENNTITTISTKEEGRKIYVNGKPDVLVINI